MQRSRSPTGGAGRPAAGENPVSRFCGRDLALEEVHLFGLTGGIASGKSAVAARLSARGVPVIDADAIAREVVRKGSPALAEIAAALLEKYTSNSLASLQATMKAAEDLARNHVSNWRDD